MDQERRELSTADLARTAEVPDRAVKDVRAENKVTEAETRAMLFKDDEAARMRADWDDIQAAFVDAPREAVKRADTLVADTMKRMAATFSNERSTLEQQWDRGDNVTTEDLRVALQRYRAFFDRLLSV